MAKNNQRDASLRAVTVARVNQLVKGGLSKAASFEKISGETGRAKDAVQMLYYRAIRAAKAGSKGAAKTAPKTAPKGVIAKPLAQVGAVVKAPVAKSARRSSRAAARPRSVIASGDFPALLDGIAAAINNLLKHVEKTVEENKTLKEQAQRLQAITSLIRGR